MPMSEVVPERAVLIVENEQIGLSKISDVRNTSQYRNDIKYSFQ